MSEWALKRFWKKAGHAPVENGFSVTLDERPVRSPAKALLILPTEAYAKAVAAEWDAQGELIDPRSMPFTRTANSALDNVAKNHAEIATLIAEYGGTDLLCYRAESPAGLAQRQAAAWDPMLAWAETTLQARLTPGTGLMHIAQPEDALEQLSRRVHQLDPFRLAAFHDLVTLSGSLILGFTVIEGRQDPHAAWEMSRIDEIWQAEQWGEDEEASAFAAQKRTDFLHAAQVFDLLARA